jgi:hypothetical protein
MKMLSKSYKSVRAFDSRLESIKKTGSSFEAALADHGDWGPELKPVLEAVTWLEQHKKAADPRPGFVSASWKRVLKNIHTGRENITFPGVKGRMQIRFAFRSALAVCFALVLLLNTSMIASAARSASPGNIFYKVKKAEESVHFAFTNSAQENAGLHISMMKRRAAEIEELLLEGRYEHIGPAAAEFEYHLTKAWTAIDYWRIADFQAANAKGEELRWNLNNQVLVWQTLLKAAPLQVMDSLAHAIQAAKQ